MNEQQAVATETDTSSETGKEAGGAQEPTVDELLAQFDQKTEPDTKTANLDKGRLEQVFDFVEQQSQREQQERTQKDIESAVKTVIGESDLDPDYVDAALWRKANKDTAFLNAFQQREKSPEQWSQVLRAMGREMSAKQTKPDQNTTNDREAVAAAVRGASTTKSPDGKPITRQSLKKMDDNEFGKLIKSMGA